MINVNVVSVVRDSNDHDMVRLMNMRKLMNHVPDVVDEIVSEVGRGR